MRVIFLNTFDKKNFINIILAMQIFILKIITSPTIEYKYVAQQNLAFTYETK